MFRRSSFLIKRKKKKTKTKNCVALQKCCSLIRPPLFPSGFLLFMNPLQFLGYDHTVMPHIKYEICYGKKKLGSLYNIVDAFECYRRKVDEDDISFFLDIKAKEKTNNAVA